MEGFSQGNEMYATYAERVAAFRYHIQQAIVAAVIDENQDYVKQYVEDMIAMCAASNDQERSSIHARVILEIQALTEKGYMVVLLER